MGNEKESEAGKRDRYMRDFLATFTGKLDLETVYDGRWEQFLCPQTRDYWHGYIAGRDA